ncbi:DUF6797 domain-containing protein [Novipirellula caenicola]|uniref:DUF6797 domain-containing protein n=1 Tax=Novipirellula caenicola TaxID=1536901 RepID=UPI0031E9C2CD
MLRPDNLVAWCIVPFDAKNRTPEARAAMLQELGITRAAYDWRAAHVPTFEQEILAYQKHRIEFFAFWGVQENAFKLFEKYDLHPQIWQMLRDNDGDTQAVKVEAAAQQMLPLAKRTAAMGCPLALYNHGGWGGEPQNLVAVCQRLHELGQTHVGIVYNFHHAHGHIDDWAASFAIMKPFLHCLNLNGMNADEQPKILGIGKGQHELEMIRVVVDSGYDGPIGILDHRNELDARDSLIENRDGLQWVRQELEKRGSAGPLPATPSSYTKPNEEPNAGLGRIFPGADGYRNPPITVEVRATMHRHDRYNILVASDSKKSSDHWELFSMNRSGHLTAYLPGKVPDHVHTNAMICDGDPHTLSMTYEPGRIRIFVDGQQVADQPLTDAKQRTSVPGALGIGRLVQRDLGFDGEIQWVRISKGVRPIPDKPLVDVSRDDATLGLWKFGNEHAPDSPRVDQHSGIDSGRSNVDPAPVATEMPYDPKTVTRIIHESNASGEAARGVHVFADAKLGCLSCHKIGDHGGSIGPDLSAIVKDRTPAQIVESVFWPQRDVAAEYMNWKVLTADGNVITGFKHSSDDQQVVIRDSATGKLTRIAADEIEAEIPAGSVMPSGLTATLSSQQQLDLIRFLIDLGRDQGRLSESIQHAIAHSQMHGPAEAPLSSAPLAAENWPHAEHRVNRDRLYDFYTKQAEYFRNQPHPPMLISPYPGLDGGEQGHWGNQSEPDWKDDRWNSTQLGSVQAGVFRWRGIKVPRGVCIRIGEDDEMSACFNPETLSYEAVWTGGFVKYDSVRFGFVGGLRPDGDLLEVPKTEKITEPFQYHGFYRHGKRTVFSYTIGDVHYLDCAWVDDGKFVRDVAPAEQHPLSHVTSGGPQQWPDVIETKITRGNQNPYAIDTIELPTDNPWNALLFCGGHDFLPVGSALVCTMQGDVWRVRGIDATKDDESKARWTRFASGLHHALGLVVADGQVYVQCRDQLTRLSDLNGDGEADFYECFSNAFVTSAAGHDFICGLQRDQQGNFYTASGNQGLLRISPDGKQADVIATGFRNPDGLGILPNGMVTVPVSEGTWTPASAIHAVPPSALSSTGNPPHHGYGGPKNGQPPELPLVYLPRGLDNSSGGQAYVDSHAFGPLQTQLLHFSFGSGSWFSVLRDQVNQQIQGAVVPLAGDFLSGVHRGRFHPIDGQLYVSGMTGWGSYTRDDGCFQRVRYTGQPAQVPVGFHVHENGIQVTFSMPIDEAIASNPEQHFAQCWNYRYSGGYGSPEYSTTHPGTAGHDPLRIQSAHVLDDRHSLFLEIPDLQPVNQLHLRMHVNDDNHPSCNPAGDGQDMFITVHQLDEPFTQFPGYQVAEKQIAAHPLRVDIASMAERVSNPWHQKIKAARPIKVETGSNLTYNTAEFNVRTNEPLAVTLANPDVVPHNWVLVQQASLQHVGELGNQMIADPKAFARQYVPESDQVIAHTDIVLPGQQQTIYFIAPSAPGRYPFLCTFPGHWMVMNGVMVVEPAAR